ncbi:MAG: GAP family protein [Saccharothrix sp.]|nr:GAP family protein [Saccharothrix sp.]
MGEAIGHVLPLAVGVALSPVPIIAVVLMLTTPKARVNGPAFVLGWVVGLAVVGAVVLLVAGSGADDVDGKPAAWASWLKLVLGALLLLVAVKQFRGRPGPDEQPVMPGWMDAVDRFTSVKAMATGLLLAGANPKNLLLAVSAATTVAQTGIAGGAQVVAYAVFAVIATLGVGAPVVVHLALGARAAEVLAHLKEWMSRNNAVIMSVLCLVLGVKLVGDAIGGLTG